MNLGQHLVEYGAVDAAALRARMLEQPEEFWEVDTAARTHLAGDRTGRAVFFYNDAPPCIPRPLILETRAGANVLRYPDRPLFAEIEALIDSGIRPLFPDCDVLRVQLADLPPGGVIEPHHDDGILALVHRLHVPVVTHRRVKFTIAGAGYFLAEDQLYDLNNAVVHTVENASEAMRVHLLVDMLPHRYARARYHDGEAAMVAACAGFAQAS